MAINEWVFDAPAWRYNASCGASLVVRDNNFDVCLPSGRHIRGTAADVEAAKAAAMAEYESYVLKQWAKGCPCAGGVWKTMLR